MLEQLFNRLFTTPELPYCRMSGSQKDKVHFTTNEFDYPSIREKITVRGGLHIAIAGGLDPVFDQIAVANPRLTVMVDIDFSTVRHLNKGRLAALNEAENSEQYWQLQVEYFHNVLRKINPKRRDIPTDANDGWSADQSRFEKVKQAFMENKIKIIQGNFLDKIDLFFQLAQESQIPIKLIYVSNIFDSLSNDLDAFKKKLRVGITQGVIASDAQIIWTNSPEGLKTQITDVATYIQ